MADETTAGVRDHGWDGLYRHDDGTSWRVDAVDEDAFELHAADDPAVRRSVSLESFRYNYVFRGDRTAPAGVRG